MSDPNFLPYAATAPTSRDADHLRVLSILHYVWGGIILCFSCLTLIYIGVGAMMVSGHFPWGPSGPGAPPPPPASVGWILIGAGTCGMTLGGAIGAATIVSGRRMMQRRSRVFSIVVASISCLSIPLGTTLGIFTLVVLMRESVKAAYAQVPGT